MGTLIEEMRAGTLLGTEGCLPSAKGARVRRSGEQFAATDGPFAETKEVVGGFAPLQTKSKEEAIALAKSFLKVGGDGGCEIRRPYEPSTSDPNSRQNSPRRTSARNG